MNALEVGIAIHQKLEDELATVAMQTKPAKPFPRVGDTVQIRHQVKRSSSGEVLGIQRADGRPVNTKITAVYMDGSVRCGHSDVWEVKPGTVGHWETVNPYRGDNAREAI